jgi:hypothetical protein
LEEDGSQKGRTKNWGGNLGISRAAESHVNFKRNFTRALKFRKRNCLFFQHPFASIFVATGAGKSSFRSGAGTNFSHLDFREECENPQIASKSHRNFQDLIVCSRYKDQKRRRQRCGSTTKIKKRGLTASKQTSLFEHILGLFSP